MANYYTSRPVMVSNPQGLHARPAHALASLANRFQSHIEIMRDGESADAKSILAILTLAAVQGTELILKANGEDALEALEALADLFAKGFGENGEQSQKQESGTGGERQS